MPEASSTQGTRAMADRRTWDALAALRLNKDTSQERLSATRPAFGVMARQSERVTPSGIIRSSYTIERKSFGSYMSPTSASLGKRIDAPSPNGGSASPTSHAAKRPRLTPPSEEDKEVEEALSLALGLSSPEINEDGAFAVAETGPSNRSTRGRRVPRITVHPAHDDQPEVVSIGSSDSEEEVFELETTPRQGPHYLLDDGSDDDLPSDPMDVILPRNVVKGKQAIRPSRSTALALLHARKRSSQSGRANALASQLNNVAVPAVSGHVNLRQAPLQAQSIEAEPSDRSFELCPTDGNTSYGDVIASAAPFRHPPELPPELPKPDPEIRTRLSITIIPSSSTGPSASSVSSAPSVPSPLRPNRFQPYLDFFAGRVRAPVTARPRSRSAVSATDVSVPVEHLPVLRHGRTPIPGSLNLNSHISPSTTILNHNHPLPATYRTLLRPSPLQPILGQATRPSGSSHLATTPSPPYRAKSDSLPLVSRPIYLHRTTRATGERAKLQAKWDEETRKTASARLIICGSIAGDRSSIPPLPDDFVYIEREYVYGPLVVHEHPIRYLAQDFKHCCTVDDRPCVIHQRSDRHYCSTSITKFQGGEYAYDENGLFTFNIPGHIVIQECHRFCLCDKEKCQFSLAQRPRRHVLEVFQTEWCGWGVRAVVDLQRGEVMGMYMGEFITRDEQYRRSELGQGDYIFDLDAEEKRSDFSTDGKFSVDAEHCGNWTRFINNSCEPNLIVRTVNFDAPTKQHPGRLVFITDRDIDAGEELSFQYTPSHAVAAEDIPSKPRCRCGALSCRGWY